MITSINTTIRPATPADYAATEFLTREAFWNIYKQGCDEHLVLHLLRKSKSYIGELDLVAVGEVSIIGHILSTRAKVVNAENAEQEILCVGPLSAAPALQHRGIGSMLMKASIGRAREMGFAGMILFGNPDYYHRFGFCNAQQYNITTKEGDNFEPFMALELQPDGLSTVSGRFFEDPAFMVQPDDLEVFEQQFPYQEKLVTDTQLQH